MKLLETYSQRLMLTLELKKARLPYSFVLALLGLGGAFLLFGFIDRTLIYYFEGFFSIAVGVVLFVVETAWRRIVELKAFLSEYRKAERHAGTQAPDAAVETVLSAGETDMDLADREEESEARGELVEFELLP